VPAPSGQARHGVDAYPSGRARPLPRWLRVTPRLLFLLSGCNRPLSASLRAPRDSRCGWLVRVGSRHPTTDGGSGRPWAGSCWVTS